MTTPRTELEAMSEEKLNLALFDAARNLRAQGTPTLALAVEEAARRLRGHQTVTDDMVWRVCGTGMVLGRERTLCERCPKKEDFSHHGEGTRMCRLIAQRVCQAALPPPPRAEEGDTK